MNSQIDLAPLNFEHSVTNEALRQIIDHVPLPCVLRDVYYRVVYSNQPVWDLFDFYDSTEMVNCVGELSPPYQPDGSPSRTKFRSLMNDVLTKGDTAKFDWLYFRKDRELIPAEVTLLRVVLGGRSYIMEFIKDQRESKQALIEEHASRQRLQAMMDSCPIACGIVDEHFNVVECNNEVVHLFGLLNKQSFMKRFFQLSPEKQPNGELSRLKALDKLKETFENGRAHYEWMHQNMEDVQIPCEVTLVRVRLSEQEHAIMYISDLRELRDSVAMMQKMETIAYTDELTGLYSRRYFMENASIALEKCKAEGKCFHIIMTDLDYFKRINDNFGHQVGDEVLKISAKRMMGVTRQSNIIARYGGEEFIIMITEVPYDSAIKNAERIHKTMEESPFIIKDMSMNITVSQGISTLLTHEDTLDDIIHRADTALYTAKRTGRNKFVEYDKKMDTM
ncbi:MAG: GGDEF domain-containing protein [Defluviitaleaceae bacterium]|nr:GGDEF domain-containing protein [Defluviitaleaceae bacterium]MCL2262540.1 GGDEF domain-containing protein [Defluviitaleaceae bacterium]